MGPSGAVPNQPESIRTIPARRRAPLRQNQEQTTLDRSSFRTWLEQRGGLGKGAIDSYIADAGRVERHYGDLDKLYEEDRLAEALKAEIPDVADKNRPSYRSAVRRYREYRDTVEDPVVDDDGARERLFGLERDLQAALRDCIEQLEPGLEITDGGAERSVASGFIDITAKAPDGTVVVIELKAGAARREAIGQILSYMGDIADEEPGRVRGILVAGDFNDKARAAARVVPTLSLRRYRVTFEFSPPS